MYFEASKIKWFEELLLQTFFSFSIPYHIRKISILLETLINTRKIKGSECGSKSRQIEHLYPYHIRKISICLQTLTNTRKIKGFILLNFFSNFRIFSSSILRTISILKKPWFFNGFSTFWQNNSVKLFLCIPLLYI